MKNTGSFRKEQQSVVFDAQKDHFFQKGNNILPSPSPSYRFPLLPGHQVSLVEIPPLLNSSRVALHPKVGGGYSIPSSSTYDVRVRYSVNKQV